MSEKMTAQEANAASVEGIKRMLEREYESVLEKIEKATRVGNFKVKINLMLSTYAKDIAARLKADGYEVKIKTPWFGGLVDMIIEW